MGLIKWAPSDPPRMWGSMLGSSIELRACAQAHAPPELMQWNNGHGGWMPHVNQACTGRGYLQACSWPEPL